MTSPSLLSRESTTLSPRWLQYGHFTSGSRGLGASRQLPHRAEIQPGLRRKDRAEHKGGQKRKRMKNDGRADRGVIWRAEKRSCSKAECFVEAADRARRGHGAADHQDRNHQEGTG